MKNSEQGVEGAAIEYGRSGKARSGRGVLLWIGVSAIALPFVLAFLSPFLVYVHLPIRSARENSLVNGLLRMSPMGLAVCVCIWAAVRAFGRKAGWLPLVLVSMGLILNGGLLGIMGVQWWTIFLKH